MAYINVAEWSTDQVTDWLKGLDDSMYSYVYSFTNNEVGGLQLLNIRPYELEQLGMHSIGHQEIVLEAVENLRNFHYNLDKENLQFMALHVATAARCLHRQLATHCDASKIETKILNDITRTIAAIKPLIGWLDRAPFQGQFQFTEICRNMLRLGLEMATIAQRDRFVERPVEQIRSTAEKLERLANYIIQDITDPMLLQPASLNLVTFKKRESELGFNIESNYHGIHRVTDIKYNSPAHNSGKIEDGDEIVQINYQTVVGWQYKTVLLQLRDSLPDVLLTLKKRPKHTKIYGQIYMQPYRLPSKKRVVGTRWGENLPSPRAGFLAVPDGAFNMPLKTEEKAAVAASSDTDSSCSDILTPTDAKSAEKEIRLYYPKPRAMLQRRNTICGDELLGHKSLGGTPFWHERKPSAVGDPSSPSLRDKSVSFGFGLEIAPRPTTCIGIATGTSKFINDKKSVINDSKSLQVPEMIVELSSEASEKSKPGVSKVVRFDANMKYEDYPVDEKYTCNVENTILETFEPIPFADEEDDVVEALQNASGKVESILEAIDKATKGSNTELVEAVNVPMITRRARLDKSHSTPAYDNSGEESDTPPAIEPRKEFLLQTPPVPPPRPRKQKDLVPPNVPPPPPKPSQLTQVANMSNQSITSIEPAVQVDTKNSDLNITFSKQSLSIPITEQITVVSELHTPTKTRTLTLKKKHSLIAKRRNVNLKLLGTGDIQGHLYRRTKNRRGVTFWARLYFVMLDTILYGFRSKDASKASCVIFLPGFTVSLAKEVHSKPFAFKVYHSAKTFYFAVESQDALKQWIELIRLATLHSHPTSMVHNVSGTDLPVQEINAKELFSETDSSGDESESVVSKNLCTPSPQSGKDFTTSTSSATKSSTTPTSSKQDRRYLGSLRKLTKGTLPFKSSSSGEKKPSSDIPVPTEQYRSYRKVPGGSFGIQIGTNTPGYHDPSVHSFNFQNISGCSVGTEYSGVQGKVSLSSSRSSIISNDLNSMCLGPPSSPAPIPNQMHQMHQMHSAVPPTLLCTSSSRDNSFDNPGKAIRKIPYNFIHASNPNLVEFDFQTSKTLDYSLPKINPSNSWDAHQNMQGLVTLKDLMLQKQEEEAQEMYNNRVLLGVEKKDERKRNTPRREYRTEENSNSNTHSGSNKLSKTQSRSLPKTPDYEISFKPDDEDIKRTRTKEGLKLRDFGYELISGDEPIGGIITSRQNSNTSSSSVDQHNWTSAMKSRQFLKSQQFLISTQKSKKHSSNSCSSTSSADFAGIHMEKRAGSLKKKGKLEAFKTSSERLFQFSKHSSGNSSSMTMTLPLNKKSNQPLESSGSGRGIKKSHTYNNDLKEKAAIKYDAQRKNSAPMPIFSKLSFTSTGSTTSNGNINSKTSKEKKLLGSPLLHRTIFGNAHVHGGNCGSGGGFAVLPTSSGANREYDRDAIFSQVIFPKYCGDSGSNKVRNLSLSNASITAPDIVAPLPPSIVQPPPLPPHERDLKCSTSGVGVATPEYPNMECPPVFEPEIYSLTEPNASLSILLRRNNSNVTDEKK